MKKVVFLIINVIIATGIWAQDTYSTFYYQRATLFEQLSIDSADIVFIGNSIVNGAEWSELFKNKKVKNRGISGDVCQGVYDRLSVITKGAPSKVFLLIGINDLGRGGEPELIIEGIKNIVDKINAESPRTLIYLQSILPVNDSFGMFSGHTKRWKEIKPLNRKLKELAKSKQITYIDLYSEFVEAGTDKLNPQYTNDGLHLLGAGYMKWVEVVEPYI